MITNTAKQARKLVNDMLGMIDASELRGQSELVSSTQLPVKVRGDKARLEAAGVVFGEPCKGDELFCDAVLPDGWKIEATDHSLWSKLIDANRNKQARIFYKAVFYDRDAFMDVTSAGGNSDGQTGV